jgi:hypothetical protein
MPIGWVAVGNPAPEVRRRFSDEDIEAHCRQRLQTLYHPVGTCRMGDDPSASVVDRFGPFGSNGRYGASTGRCSARAPG